MFYYDKRDVYFYPLSWGVQTFALNSIYKPAAIMDIQYTYKGMYRTFDSCYI